MSKKASRYEDMGDGILSVSEDDGMIKISTIPPLDSLTFTGSGGQSKNTLQALRHLFCEMQKDNEETYQESVFDKGDCQSRCQDDVSGSGQRGQMIVSSYGDIKLTITSDGAILFKAPDTGGKSKYTYQAIQNLIVALQKDNEERPQKRG